MLALDRLGLTLNTDSYRWREGVGVKKKRKEGEMHEMQIASTSTGKEPTEPHRRCHCPCTHVRFLPSLLQSKGFFGGRWRAGVDQYID